MEIFNNPEIVSQIGLKLYIPQIHKLHMLNKLCNHILNDNYFWKCKFLQDYHNKISNNYKKEYLIYKPSLAKSAYIFFYRDNLKLMSENEDARVNILKVANIWRNVNNDIKNQYILLAEQDKCRYSKEIIIYGYNHPQSTSEESDTCTSEESE